MSSSPILSRFSSALVGATVGAASFGPLSDRFGRKTLLIVAVLLIGGFTILTVFANSVPMLMAIRILAGLGLGGATPCFIALTSEYTPARLRAALVTLMWSAFPLGGLLGGLLNWYLIPHAGWRAIFYIGGIAPLVLAVVLFFYLPESIEVPSRPAQRHEGRRPHRCPLPLVPCPGRRAFFPGREDPCQVPRFGTCSRKAERLERYCCGFRFSWVSAYSRSRSCGHLRY